MPQAQRQTQRRGRPGSVAALPMHRHPIAQWEPCAAPSRRPTGGFRSLAKAVALLRPATPSNVPIPETATLWTAVMSPVACSADHLVQVPLSAIPRTGLAKRKRARLLFLYLGNRRPLISAATERSGKARPTLRMIDELRQISSGDTMRPAMALAATTSGLARYTLPGPLRPGKLRFCALTVTCSGP